MDTEKKTEKPLEVGMKVKVFYGGEFMSEAVIRSLETDEIKIETQTGMFTYILIRGGWRWLFTDPMSGCGCYSERAFCYTFQPV